MCQPAIPIKNFQLSSCAVQGGQQLCRENYVSLPQEVILIKIKK